MDRPTEGSNSRKRPGRYGTRYGWAGLEQQASISGRPFKSPTPAKNLTSTQLCGILAPFAAPPDGPATEYDAMTRRSTYGTIAAMMAFLALMLTTALACASAVSDQTAPASPAVESTASGPPTPKLPKGPDGTQQHQTVLPSSATPTIATQDLEHSPTLAPTQSPTATPIIPSAPFPTVTTTETLARRGMLPAPSINFCISLDRWQNPSEFAKYEYTCQHLYKETAWANCGVTDAEWHSPDFIPAEKQVCIKSEYQPISDDFHYRHRLGYDCYGVGHNAADFAKCFNAAHDHNLQISFAMPEAFSLLFATVETNERVMQSDKQMRTCLHSNQKQSVPDNSGSSHLLFWLDSNTDVMSGYLDDRSTARLAKLQQYADAVHACANKTGYYDTYYDVFAYELARLANSGHSSVEALVVTGAAKHMLQAGPTIFALNNNR